MKKRTQGREVALRYLYTVELVGKEEVASFDKFLQFLESSSLFEQEWDETFLDKNVLEFASKIVQGCLENWDELTQKMQKVISNFRFERVFPIDRAILRIALFEIAEIKEIPIKVSMNEAIELGKKYSTEKSGSFINGVLEKLKNTHS